MKKKPLTETASEIWHSLAKDHKDPFHIDKARIFAISANGFTRVLVTAHDVYIALDRCGNGHHTLLKDEIGIGVETCGWAAPVSDTNDDELAPSQHPERKRVRLVACVNTKLQAGSALGFSTEADLITDDGHAKGSLADALINAMKKMVVRKN